MPASPGPADDDPALFEAELRAREARLGASHPDVAEALSNLAIIYNQVRVLVEWWPGRGDRALEKGSWRRGQAC
jgi:hypothetical protein